MLGRLINPADFDRRMVLADYINLFMRFGVIALCVFLFRGGYWVTAWLVLAYVVFDNLLLVIAVRKYLKFKRLKIARKSETL